MSKSFNPSVSIIIPVFNGANYLREAIDSALGQTYSNIEVIVVNDGSTDGGKTEDIAISYGSQVRYFSKENGGVATALNFGIGKMTGEYFSWLSHDDIYMPCKIETQIAALKSVSDKTTILYGDYTLINARGNVIREEDISKRLKPEQLNNNLAALLRSLIGGCTLLIHRSLFERYGYFNSSLITTQDYDLWFRMFKNCALYYVHGSTVRSRIHDEQVSRGMSELHLIECEKLWHHIFQSLSRAEMIHAEGSVWTFYQQMHRFFTDNGFLVKKTTAYLFSQMLLELRDLYRDSNDHHEKENVLGILYRELQIRHEEDKSNVKYALSVPQKSKPRIVFWSDNWSYRGGLNRVLALVSSALAPGYDICLGVGKQADTNKGYEVSAAVRFFEFDLSRDPDLSRLPKLLLLMKVDIFVCSNNWLYNYLLLYTQCKEMGIKTIAWDHTHYFLPYNSPDLTDVAYAKNKALINADAIVSVNSLSASIYRHIFERTVLISNPATFVVTSGPTLPVSHPKNIVGVALFNDKNKRLDRLIMVFAEVLVKLPDTKLYVVGKYDLDTPVQDSGNETIAELIIRLQIKDGSIVFTGHVDDVENYYGKSAVHVMTSEWEGFGLAITEAAYFGLPSVVFSGNGADDIITDGVDGYIVPRNNIHAMAERIIALLTDHALLASMQTAALKIPHQYDLEIIGKNWRTLIDAILFLNHHELKQFLNAQFLTPPHNSEQMFKDVVLKYEEAIHKLLAFQSKKNNPDKKNFLYCFARKILYKIFSLPVVGKLFNSLYVTIK